MSTPEETVKKVYEESIVIDSLNVSNWDSPAVFRSLEAGGITAINATVATWENFGETLDHIAAWLRRFRGNETLLQVKTVEDIRQAKTEGKVGIILGSQNASPIENDLDRLELLHQLGMRIIQLTYNERNLLGNGCWERRDEGLSDFGVAAVREMNRLGIVIDLSHVGDRTTLEAIDLSEMPVAITHANARAYHDHPRNKTDEVLKLLVEKNGVVGSTAITAFLRTGTKSTVDDYVDAIDDLVERVGIDHVGVGTDYTQDQPESFWKYITSQQGTKYPSTYSRAWAGPAEMANDTTLYPKDLEVPDKFPNLAVALGNRGYQPEDITKILGGNWLRLFGEVWSDAD